MTNLSASEKKQDRKPRILLGLSGGIDSAVAGALLKSQGFDVVSVYFQMGEHSRFLCRRSDRDAESVAQKLEVPFSQVDVGGRFESEVIDPLVHARLQANRARSCFSCHQSILIPSLIQKADEMGIHLVATGHFAQFQHDPVSGETRLASAANPDRDQSHLLAGISLELLKRIVFPMGDLTEQLSDRLAEELGFSDLDRGDCPLATRAGSAVLQPMVDALVRSRSSDSLHRKGIVRNRAGRVLCDYVGISQYRVGQKVEYSTAMPEGEEWFVLGFVPSHDTVIVGAHRELSRSSFLASSARWVKPQDELRGADVQVMLEPGEPMVPGKISFFANHVVRVELEDAAITPDPGQVVIFYRQGEVLGSALVDPFDASRWASEVGV